MKESRSVTASALTYMRRNTMKKCLIGILILLVGVCALALWQVVPYYVESAASEKEFRELSERFDVTGAHDESKAETYDFVVEAVNDLQRQNPDMIGWLKIEDTTIDYPVMWTPQDEQYYLYRAFDKTKSKDGTPFLDVDCNVTDPNKNLIIYGHNMKTGTMFGALMDYKKKEFWKEHPQIVFTTAEQTESYDIFAVVQTDTKEGYFIYQMICNDSEMNFTENVQKIKAMSLYDTDITPVWEDKLIILSTCEYSRPNGRLIILGYDKI